MTPQWKSEACMKRYTSYPSFWCTTVTEWATMCFILSKHWQRSSFQISFTYALLNLELFAKPVLLMIFPMSSYKDATSIAYSGMLDLIEFARHRNPWRFAAFSGSGRLNKLSINHLWIELDTFNIHFLPHEVIALEQRFVLWGFNLTWNFRSLWNTSSKRVRRSSKLRLYTKISSIQTRTQIYKISSRTSIIPAWKAWALSVFPWINRVGINTPSSVKKEYTSWLSSARGNCQNPLKASRLENQAAFSRCWKFTSRIERKPAAGWNWEFAYLQWQSTVILNSSRFLGLGTITTGEEHQLLEFLRMSPFFSSMFTCLIIQSLSCELLLALGRHQISNEPWKASALLGRHQSHWPSTCLGTSQPESGAWPIAPRPDICLPFEALQRKPDQARSHRRLPESSPHHPHSLIIDFATVTTSFTVIFIFTSFSSVASTTSDPASLSFFNSDFGTAVVKGPEYRM